MHENHLLDHHFDGVNANRELLVCRNGVGDTTAAGGYFGVEQHPAS